MVLAKSPSPGGDAGVVLVPDANSRPGKIIARTVQRVLGWNNPFRTIAVVVYPDDRAAVFLREQEVHRVDRDLMWGMTHLITHHREIPRHVPSLVREVDDYIIEEVQSAAEALAERLRREQNLPESNTRSYPR